MNQMHKNKNIKNNWKVYDNDTALSRRRSFADFELGDLRDYSVPQNTHFNGANSMDYRPQKQRIKSERFLENFPTQKVCANPMGPNI